MLLGAGAALLGMADRVPARRAAARRAASRPRARSRGGSSCRATDFHRVTDLCTLLIVVSGVYLFSTTGTARSADGPRAMTLLFQWFPLLLFPLIASQVYSTAGKVPLTAFFWGLRRQAARDPGVRGPAPVDLGYLYFALCILSASAANRRTLEFYVGALRPRGLGALVLALAPVLAALVGAAARRRGRRWAMAATSCCIGSSRSSSRRRSTTSSVSSIATRTRSGLRRPSATWVA